ncbi:MAG: LPS assembly protein LptD [Pseudomonadota bacterium]
MIKLAKAVIIYFIILFSGGSFALEDNVIKANKDPVMLTADAVNYDEKTSIAFASGHVEVVQGETILLADKLTYNQTTDEIHAVGNVSILQPSGDVVFSDEVRLKQSLEKGVAKEFKVRLKDNSLFAAREGEKINKNVTELKNVVYSPCKICVPKAGEDAKAPLWQVKAQKVTIDEEEQRVRYKNAFMEVYGIPMLYTPYFSNPTPDAPSQSGLLLPQYFHSSNLGNIVKQPGFIAIAPNMDMTLTPWYLSRENPLLEGEFRHLLENGFYEIKGAITDAKNRDLAGNVISGTEFRHYLDAHGRLQLNENWDSGIDVKRTSDNTFLALYGLGWQSILTSRLYAERIKDRDYAVVEALAFQGLQPQDISSQSPYIFPQTNVHLESSQLFANSRLEFDNNTLVLERQQGNSDRRLSSSVAWKLPIVTKSGQIIETKLSVRGDAYSITNQTIDNSTKDLFSGNTGRVIPQAEIDWRYPFIKRFGNESSLMIAPIVEVAASPNLRNSSKIPNEDSQIAELNDVNLFSANRFSGLDALESGVRGTYGTRGNLQFADKEYINWLVGQTYQENQSSPFPISQDATAHFSDYIAHIGAKYKWVDLSYNIRLKRETGSPTSNDVNVGFNLSPVTLNATYISLIDQPFFGNREEVFGNAILEINENWSWNLSGRKDLGSNTTTSSSTSSNAAALNILDPSNGTVGLGTGLVFHNECLMITTNLARNYISLQDVKPATTFSVDVVLKNFGLPDQAKQASNIAPGAEKEITNYDK